MLSRFRHKNRPAASALDISEKHGIRSLHINSPTIQSSMRISHPHELVLEYTRAVLAFLLFVPQPRHVVTIGLGGGSIPKFIHAHLPEVRQTVLEIDPQVLAVARSMFCVPADDERLTVELGDGAAWVALHPASCDVLVVDGFDGEDIAAPLCSELFFADCHRALTTDGVLVMNLWGSHAHFALYLDRIHQAFGGLSLCLPARKHGNILVFGFRRPQGNPEWADLYRRAELLKQQLGLEFDDFVSDLRPLNAHSQRRLLI